MKLISQKSRVVNKRDFDLKPSGITSPTHNSIVEFNYKGTNIKLLLNVDNRVLDMLIIFLLRFVVKQPNGENK